MTHSPACAETLFEFVLAINQDCLQAKHDICLKIGGSSILSVLLPGSQTHRHYCTSKQSSLVPLPKTAFHRKWEQRLKRLAWIYRVRACNTQHNNAINRSPSLFPLQLTTSEDRPSTVLNNSSSPVPLRCLRPHPLSHHCPAVESAVAAYPRCVS